MNHASISKMQNYKQHYKKIEENMCDFGLGKSPQIQQQKHDP